MPLNCPFSFLQVPRRWLRASASQQPPRGAGPNCPRSTPPTPSPPFSGMGCRRTTSSTPSRTRSTPMIITPRITRTRGARRFVCLHARVSAGGVLKGRAAEVVWARGRLLQGIVLYSSYCEEMPHESESCRSMCLKVRSGGRASTACGWASKATPSMVSDAARRARTTARWVRHPASTGHAVAGRAT